MKLSPAAAIAPFITRRNKSLLDELPIAQAHVTSHIYSQHCSLGAMSLSPGNALATSVQPLGALPSPCQPLINVSRVVCGALAFWMLEAVVMGEARVVTPFLHATSGGIQGTSKVLSRRKTAKCPLRL